EIYSIAGLKRKLADLFGLYCGGDVGRLSLQYLTRAFYHDRFARRADFERYVSGRGDADVDLYVLQDSLLESTGFDRHCVRSGAESRHSVCSITGRGHIGLRAGRVIFDDHYGAGNRGSTLIEH